MELTLCPNTLRGHITAPSSKSAMHRALICAALSDRETLICCGKACADVLATAECLRSLGAEIREEACGFSVLPITSAPEHAVLVCGESGSTLRFLLPVAAALGAAAEFRLSGRLGARPLQPLLDVLSKNGCRIIKSSERLYISGRLHAGSYEIDASASSQFLSGFMFALPLLPCSELRVCGESVSKGYVNLTAAILNEFGLESVLTGDRMRISGTYRSPGTFRAEGDWSAASVWFAANALGSQITVHGLSGKSLQGDRAVCALSERIVRGSAVIDCTQIPDLVPALAVIAAASPGETRFVHAARLRGKESDRLRAVCAMLTALGADCIETTDGLEIRQSAPLHGGVIDCFGDHRIAMAAAVAATVCFGKVTLLGAECVEKSYPDFWRDYRLLGGELQ